MEIGDFGMGSGGYYNETGMWIQTKYCFTSCGDACDCQPPNGVYQLPLLLLNKDIIIEE